MEDRPVAATAADLSFVAGRPMTLGIAASPRVQHGLFLLLVVLAVAWNWTAFVAVMSRALKYSNEEYSHIALVPALSAYLLFTSRRAIGRQAHVALVPGMLLTALGVAVGWMSWSSAAVIGDYETRLSVGMMAVVVMWAGGFVLAYGTRALAHAAYPLLLLLFMVPFPPAMLDAVTLFLQTASADVSSLFFTLIGMPAYRDGLLFALPGLTIQVARECSGIRSSLALLITGLAMAYLLLRTHTTRALFVLAIVPVAIVKNAVRIVALSWLAVYVDPRFITGSAVHRNSGIPIFLGSLAILSGLLWALHKWETRKA